MKSCLSNDKSAPSDMKKITLLLADDHPLVRQALRIALEKQSDFEVVAEASDGQEAVRLALDMVPDLVIMDINMPKLNGLEAIQEIKAKNPKIAILVLTVYDEIEHIMGAIEAGAAGYLTKKVFDKEVICAIHSVIAGETVLSREISQQVFKNSLQNSMRKRVPHNTRDKLTIRELEILQFAATGMSNKDIACRLELSLATIKGYFAEIFSKLRVGSRTEAVITGLRSGFIKIDDIK
jgi:DNA-binding NarL/FixJ family response regulator